MSLCLAGLLNPLKAHLLETLGDFKQEAVCHDERHGESALELEIPVLSALQAPGTVPT